jgi:hypothetical protein
MNDREFVVVQPERAYTSNVGQPFEQRGIGRCYQRFRDEIEAVVNISGIFGNKGFRKFDPKKQFDSLEALLAKSTGLSYVNAVWLPDWAFANPNAYSFS